MAVPYTFATATGSLPLSQLDANFSTGIVIGNTTVALGDTITTINNLTLANVTVTSASFSNVTLSGTTTVSGNTTVFSGTGARIQGDFSNATLASRTAFQDKTTNGPTGIGVLPNGSNATSAISLFNNSDPTNAAYSGIAIGPGNAALISANTGSGTALPLNIYVGSGAPERARFTTDGKFLVGTDNSAFGASSAIGKIVPTSANNVGIATGSWNNVGSAIDFYSNIGVGVTYAGSIALNGASTSYNSASDYRLKSSPQPLTGSGAFIDALQPRTWTWASDGSSGVGFIAHEVAAVSPSSVCGEKDAVNADGSPKYQSMEYGSAEFIANIVSELQSLRTRVAALEAA
jgi:hypothetical protein